MDYAISPIKCRSQVVSLTMAGLSQNSSPWGQPTMWSKLTRSWSQKWLSGRLWTSLPDVRDQEFWKVRSLWHALCHILVQGWKAIAKKLTTLLLKSGNLPDDFEIRSTWKHKLMFYLKAIRDVFVFRRSARTFMCCLLGEQPASILSHAVPSRQFLLFLVSRTGADLLEQIKIQEQAANLDIDEKVARFMGAEAREGEPSSIRTEYLLRVMGLEICRDTEVGNALKPACSPGQKKRVTTGISSKPTHNCDLSGVSKW